MVDALLGQFEESVQLRKRRKKTDALLSNLKLEFRVFIDLLIQKGSAPEQSLFDLLTQVVSQIPVSPEAWVERIFQYDVEQYRRSFLYDHSVNVAILTMILTKDDPLETTDRLLLAASALLHDVGMFLLSEELIGVPRAYTPDERRMVQEHPTKGAELLSRAKLRRIFVQSALHEHERDAGSGYPGSLNQSDIEPSARIIGLADTIESVTHVRPHREGRAFLEGFHALVCEDPLPFARGNLLRALQCLSPYPPGTLVRLSTGRLGRVVRAHATHPMRPLVECLAEPGELTEQSDLVDLRRNSMIHVVDNPV